MNGAERTRLIGVLGMLGSDHVGERASAGLLATRLLKTAGLTWADVVLPDSPASLLGGRCSEPDLRDGSMSRETCEDLLRDNMACLTAWEIDFLNGTYRRAKLTAKQMNRLNIVTLEVLQRARRAA